MPLEPRALILKKNMEACIAWGIADNESSGITQYEAVRILSKALNYIKFLESKIPENDRYVEIWRDI